MKCKTKTEQQRRKFTVPSTFINIDYDSLSVPDKFEAQTCGRVTAVKQNDALIQRLETDKMACSESSLRVLLMSRHRH